MQYVYIISNQRNGTLYIGTTRNLEGRILQHKARDSAKNFTVKYGLDRLMYYESYEMVMAGVRREKQMKKWRRS